MKKKSSFFLPYRTHHPAQHKFLWNFLLKPSAAASATQNWLLLEGAGKGHFHRGENWRVWGDRKNFGIGRFPFRSACFILAYPGRFPHLSEERKATQSRSSLNSFRAKEVGRNEADPRFICLSASLSCQIDPNFRQITFYFGINRQKINIEEREKKTF